MSDDDDVDVINNGVHQQGIGRGDIYRREDDDVIGEETEGEGIIVRGQLTLDKKKEEQQQATKLS